LPDLIEQLQGLNINKNWTSYLFHQVLFSTLEG
jgi:hypothetical protein